MKHIKFFFCFFRGFKTVGPFVVMIYRMIMGDLLRFATIYLVFVLGFSQGKYKFKQNICSPYLRQNMLLHFVNNSVL